MTVKTNIWRIDNRLFQEELIAKLDEYNDDYAGRIIVLGKNGEQYYISHFSVLNHNGLAEYAVNYHPFSPNQKQKYHKIINTIPASDFFDGRFSFLIL